MKQLKILLLFCFLLTGAHAQVDSIASIKSMLANEQSDSIKLELLDKLSWYYTTNSNDSANYYNHQMLYLAKRTKNPNAEVKAISRLARSKWNSGYTSDALKLALNALELAIELKDTLAEFTNLRQIMWIYGSVENYPKSLEYGQKLRVIAATQTIRNSNFAEIALTSALNGIGLAYQGLGQNDSALFYLKKSFAILAPQPEVWPPRAIVLGYLGNFFEDINMPDSALYYYRLSFANVPDQQSRQAGMFFKFGKMFFKKQMIDSAYIYAKKSLPIAQSMQDSIILEQSNFLLADIFHHLDKPDSAYTYLRDAVDIQRILNKRADINKTGNMLLNENLHKQQLEQQRLQAEKQYKNNLKLYSLFGVVSVFLLLSIIQFRNNKQKQKAALEIKASYEKLKATQAQLIQQEKLASLGQLTAGIAHEIKNPLNFVNNFSEVSLEMIDELRDELANAVGTRNALGTRHTLSLQEGIPEILNDIEANLRKIHEHGSRADSIVKSMLMHSRGGSGKMEPTDLNALIREYINLSFHGMRAGKNPINVNIKMDLNDSVGYVPLVVEDFSRVIVNLCNNAFDAMRDKLATLGANYSPKLSIRTQKSSDAITIEIEDNGPGIPDEIKDKILQPFFTTKKGTQGTGLGLSITNDIVKAHGGVLNISTQTGKGTTFIIELPK